MARAETIILVDSPGLGKPHIATGLALAACKQGKRVRFFGVASLVNDLLSAKNDLRLSKFIAPITKHDLVDLDELGFIPFSKDGAQLLFQLCSDLNERVSIIVTTNLRFGDWNSIGKICHCGKSYLPFAACCHLSKRMGTPCQTF